MTTAWLKQQIKYLPREEVARLRRRKQAVLAAIVPMPKLLMREGKQLERLIDKYGAEALITAVKYIEDVIRRRKHRGRGAPSKIHERRALTDIIHEWAEEYRQQGTPSRSVLKQAILDVYDFEYAGQKQRPDVQKFLKATKKKHQQGRREIQELREHLEHLSRHDPHPGIKAEAKRRLAALGPK
ncbi:MAG: hypothetical protein WCB70_24295 [Xanthobacteraceae bacterium]